MEYKRISKDELTELKRLHRAYKAEIGEEPPTQEDFARLTLAMEEKQILFFGCFAEREMIACCSVSPGWSTFDYSASGVFEDFYISPAYRHQGIARQLVRFAREESGVSSLTVGCADCDVEMYRSLGFGIALGNMLAYEG